LARLTPLPWQQVVDSAKIGQIMDLLDELGIADNTLVIAMADNGPMEPIWPETGQNGFFRGGKNDVTEGGVRVPAFASWPGVIEPGSVAGDMVHVTDLYNNFARLAGKYDEIPRDRVIDGIDQTALLLNGDTHGQRDYVHIYNRHPPFGAGFDAKACQLTPRGNPSRLSGASTSDERHHRR
jgi:arylsulfatase